MIASSRPSSLVPRPSEVICYIGIGSNLGDRKNNIEKALDLLKKNDATNLLKASSSIETEPMYYTKQPGFLNCVVKIETALSPRDLLNELKAIEKKLGRKKDGLRYGPREIDLDILTYGDEVVDEPDLKIPHPRMKERPFVLLPLAELTAT